MVRGLGALMDYYARSHWDTVHDRPAAPGHAARAVLDSALGLVPRTPGSVVLDIACGESLFLQALPHDTLRVGADLCAVPLRRVRARTDPLAGWVQADAGRLPLRTATADAVVLLSTWWAFPDLDRTAAEVARVLRPGGVLLVHTWAEAPTCRLITLGAGTIAHVRDTLIRPPGIRGPFATTEAELAATLAGAGFPAPAWHRFTHQHTASTPAEYWPEFAPLAPTAHAAYRDAPPADRDTIDRLLARLLIRQDGAPLGLTWRMAVTTR
ncbi:class I SAM-dependent methyltransferase [Actinokineospora sp.]|uniref:class I SAM-dependent methyltransferase n=1 Tax=Actinokineospora sp. TaxID=1872133 RepID=UPI0040382E28